MVEPKIEAENACLLLTDIVDSMELAQRLGDQTWNRFVQKHDEIVAQVIAAHGGTVIDRSDGTLARFPRAVRGLQGAIAIHNALAADEEFDREGLKVRIGIEFGEVLPRDSNKRNIGDDENRPQITGLAIAICARISALAMGGQTLLGHAAFDLAQRAAKGDDELAPGANWISHGKYRIKSIDFTMEVFEVGYFDKDTRNPPAGNAKCEKIREEGDSQVSPWRPSVKADVPGREQYMLIEKLGEGGFGEVWLGQHKKTGDSRTFKFCFNPKRVRALKREVWIFRHLKEKLKERSDIAKVHDINFDNPPYYLEGEYTQGGNLAEYAQKEGGLEKVPLKTRLELMAQVAEAVAAAHSVGVIHKDLKPSNILIWNDSKGNPNARLTDFGIGTVEEEFRKLIPIKKGETEVFAETTMTRNESSRTGTRLFMAPEVLAGKEASIQSDIYALGIMLYQIVACKFGHTIGEGWRDDISDPLLREDIAGCVHQDPERRFKSASELAERLRNLEARHAEVERQKKEEAERRRAEEERIRVEQERRRNEEEAERLRLEQERLKNEEEAERLRAEQERLKNEEEAERLRAEQERLKNEKEAERLRVEQERIRVEDERHRNEKEAERLRLQEERLKNQEEAERLREEQERLRRRKQEEENQKRKRLFLTVSGTLGFLLTLSIISIAYITAANRQARNALAERELAIAEKDSTLTVLTKREEELSTRNRQLIDELSARASSEIPAAISRGRLLETIQFLGNVDSELRGDWWEEGIQSAMSVLASISIASKWLENEPNIETSGKTLRNGLGLFNASFSPAGNMWVKIDRSPESDFRVEKWEVKYFNRSDFGGPIQDFNYERSNTYTRWRSQDIKVTSNERFAYFPFGNGVIFDLEKRESENISEFLPEIISRHTIYSRFSDIDIETWDDQLVVLVAGGSETLLAFIQSDGQTEITNIRDLPGIPGLFYAGRSFISPFEKKVLTASTVPMSRYRVDGRRASSYLYVCDMTGGICNTALDLEELSRKMGSRWSASQIARTLRVRFHPRTNLILLSLEDKSSPILLADLSTGQVTRLFDLGNWADWFVSPDGERLVVMTSLGHEDEDRRPENHELLVLQIHEGESGSENEIITRMRNTPSGEVMSKKFQERRLIRFTESVGIEEPTLSAIRVAVEASDSIRGRLHPLEVKYILKVSEYSIKEDAPEQAEIPSPRDDKAEVRQMILRHDWDYARAIVDIYLVLYGNAEYATIYRKLSEHPLFSYEERESLIDLLHKSTLARLVEAVNLAIVEDSMEALLEAVEFMDGVLPHYRWGPGLSNILFDIARAALDSKESSEVSIQILAISLYHICELYKLLPDRNAISPLIQPTHIVNFVTGKDNEHLPEANLYKRERFETMARLTNTSLSQIDEVPYIQLEMGLPRVEDWEALQQYLEREYRLHESLDQLEILLQASIPHIDSVETYYMAREEARNKRKGWSQLPLDRLLSASSIWRLDLDQD
ncbi:MAG: protein kinase, partial [Candidatus Sumerlaeia bacterium]|nr:protein kinase [Candidatus Sumerlaeia bacterium]